MKRLIWALFAALTDSALICLALTTLLIAIPNLIVKKVNGRITE
jgi:hypothetical protein